MAMIFTKKLPGGKESPQWYNTIEAQFMNNPPSNTEMIADVMLTHARVDYLLSRIIVEIIGVNCSWQKVDYYSRPIFENVSFLSKVKIIKAFSGGRQMRGMDSFYNDLLKMAEIRNTIAHNDISHKLASERFDKDLGKLFDELVASNESASKRLIEQPFLKYSKLCDKYYDFFSADLDVQAEQLVGGYIDE